MATDVEICEQNGWCVGTVLLGRETYSDGSSSNTVIVITGIGKKHIYAVSMRTLDEANWTLQAREWRKIGLMDVSGPIERWQWLPIPMIHDLKCVEPYFDYVANGIKTFEWRRDDRGFDVGHILVLREISCKTGLPTGRSQEVEVSYILRSDNDDAKRFGIPDGYVIMAIRRKNDGATD